MMHLAEAKLWLLIVITIGASSSAAFGALITLDPATRYQTMSGWEVHPQHGEPYCAGADTVAPQVFASAVNDLGINRVRLEIRAGAENPTDYWRQFTTGQITQSAMNAKRYEVINDNNNPAQINAAGFQFSALDDTVDDSITPMKQLVEANGEHLYINLNYVGFRSAGSVHDTNPDEYAELMLATFKHLDQKYGWTPNGIEIMLEPDNNGWSSDRTVVGTKLGNAMVKTDALLRANGYTTEFIVPSVMSTDSFPQIFAAIVAVPGAAALIDEVSYHRYGGIPATLTSIKTSAAQYGARTSMIEHIGSATNDLYEDLTVANVAAWQQYTTAFCTSDNGAQYYTLSTSNPPTITMASRTKLLRQYFKYVRSGAVRYRATSDTNGIDPVAFVNSNGKHVVVVRANNQQTLTLQGLPAGTYGAFYTTGVDNGGTVTINAYDQQLAEKTITAGQTVQFTIPAQGIITVYGKTASAPCVDTTWNPSATGKCGTVTQTSNCGATRTVAGSVTCTGGQVCTSNVCVTPPDTTPPSTVTNLQKSVTATSVTLTWSAATDNIGVTAYNVRRGSTLLATTGALTYTDSGLTPSTAYSYSVAAIDAAGNTGASGTISATTAAAPVVCGNGVVEAGEQCDTGAGRGVCPATCSLTCTTNTCAPVQTCGNNIREGTELCDTGASRGVCPATCSATCTNNTCAPTQQCGNGVVEGTEQCDGTALGGATCQSNGFTGGTLVCTSSCTVSTAACTATIGTTAPSPTGRNPQFLWTPEQQAVWLKMKAEYEQNTGAPPTTNGKLYKLLKDNADCKCRYADEGLWATIMYQVTGDTTYARSAWTTWSQTTLFTNPTGFTGNALREQGIEAVLKYDWLYPALTPAERQLFIDRMNTALAAEDLQATRVGDTDATTGEYFTAAMFYVATKDVNPNATAVFNNPHVGGFTATASDMNTLRNGLKYYAITLAEGGEWMESSGYNLGTTTLLSMGYASMKTATAPVDHYPEVGAILPKLAERDIFAVTPDLNQVYQWGDEQEPRSFTYVFRRLTNQGVLQGVTQGTPESARLHSLLKDVVTKYGATGYGSAEPWGRFFLFYNPYAQSTDWKTTPLWRYAPGQALLLRRDGFASQDSLFGAQYAPAATVDHSMLHFGNFQLYREGQWAITHPIVYNTIGIGIDGGTNQMIIEGLPQWFGIWPGSEYHKVLGVQNTADYSYIVGTQGGQSRDSNYYDPPPTFLHEFTRSLVYLPSTDDKSDIIVVFDRVHSQDPFTLPKVARYSAKELAPMNASQQEGRKQFVLHSPVQPTTTPTGFKWTAGAQVVEVASLLPAGAQPRYIDEKVRYAGVVSFADSEKLWQTRIASNNDWETFFNVIQAKDANYVTNAQLIRDTSAKVEATLVTRAGQPDVLLAFNALPSSRLPADLPGARAVYDPARVPLLNKAHLRQGNFMLTWTATTTQTRVLLFDLDPSIGWSYKIGGASATPITVAADGSASLSLTGTGTKTMEVIGGGTVVPPTPVCGNGLVEMGEQCDTAASRGVCPATCSTTCTTNTCSPPAKRGDANHDGSVNVSDVYKVAATIRAASYAGEEDLNADGRVDIYDIIATVRLFNS